MFGTTLLQYFYFAFFVLFWFLAFLQLCYKNKILLNYLLSGVFFAVGYYFFYYWTFTSGILEYLPLMHYTEISFGFLLGPLFFFYVSIITGATNIKSNYVLLHLIPFAVALILITIINTTQPSNFLQSSNNLFLLPTYSNNRYIHIIISICNVYLLLYFIFTLLQFSIFLKTKKYKFEAAIALIFIVSIIINQIILAIGNIFNYPVLKTIGIGFLSIVTIAYAFFSSRYPGFAIKVIKESKNIRYKSSILKNYDTTLIETRLVQLMEEEKIYTTENLTLQSLSAALLIKPHELSRILNESCDKNFNTFINLYRIKEAKRQLHEYPEKSVLEIAFSVGFNSKTSFYTCFMRETLVSPGEYRKKTFSDL